MLLAQHPACCVQLGDYVGWRALLLLALGKLRTLLRLTDRSAGTGTANTAMVCHAARLLALNEGDLPHALRLACDGLLEAVGRLTVSAPAGPSFTAHPKLDPLTGARPVGMHAHARACSCASAERACSHEGAASSVQAACCNCPHAPLAQASCSSSGTALTRRRSLPLACWAPRAT